MSGNHSNPDGFGKRAGVKKRSRRAAFYLVVRLDSRWRLGVFGGCWLVGVDCGWGVRWVFRCQVRYSSGDDGSWLTALALRRVCLTFGGLTTRRSLAAIAFASMSVTPHITSHFPSGFVIALLKSCQASGAAAVSLPPSSGLGTDSMIFIEERATLKH